VQIGRGAAFVQPIASVRRAKIDRVRAFSF
jgi:hypothetical protein